MVKVIIVIFVRKKSWLKNNCSPTNLLSSQLIYLIPGWVFVGNIYWKMPLTKLCRYPKKNWPNPSCIFALTVRKVWITEVLQENFSFFCQEKFSIHIMVFLSILPMTPTQFRWAIIQVSYICSLGTIRKKYLICQEDRCFLKIKRHYFTSLKTWFKD